jgi:hypothetical protein
LSRRPPRNQPSRRPRARRRRPPRQRPLGARPGPLPKPPRPAPAMPPRWPRMMNHDRLDANFWDQSFRLIVNGVPMAPESGLNELVSAESAQEGNVLFVIPHGTTDGTLEVPLALMGKAMSIGFSERDTEDGPRTDLKAENHMMPCFFRSACSSPDTHLNILGSPSSF